MTHDEFRRELSEIARPARDVLSADRAREARAAALPRAIPFVLAVPAAYLLASLALRATGYDFALPLWLVALASLVLPTVYWLVMAQGSGVKAATEGHALAHIDDELQLADRMTAAREFLDADDATPFMRAAIDDAKTHAERARRYRAEHREVQARVRPAHALWPALAALLLVASVWIPVAAYDSSAPDDAPERGDARVAALDVDEIRRDETETPPRVRETPRPPSDERQQSPDKRPGDIGSNTSNKKKSRGERGSGQSSKAQSTQGRSSGEGAATDQSQPTKGGEKLAKKTPPKDDKEAKKRSPKKRDKQPQIDRDSVATAGQGRGRGSSKSPTASEWSSKDQAVANEEEELEDEDEVDDEDEESEARGGLQPSLRQRKPPVNRDLNLSFGGGKPPPHANGRGGPGLPKKQRGVAQLVLGIPYPDQISGQPNPGRTKVTQERIEPQAQTSEAIAASAQRARSAPVGPLARPVLTPWMQDIIRAYTTKRDRAQR